MLGAPRTLNVLQHSIPTRRSSDLPTWQLKVPNLRTAEGRSRKYYWTDKTEAEEIDEAEEAGNDFPQPSKEQASAQPRALERDLYPMLIEFVSSEAGASASRINAATASNRRGLGGNKWLYPAIVAIEYLTAGMNTEVTGALQHSGERLPRFVSHAMKELLKSFHVLTAIFQKQH